MLFWDSVVNMLALFVLIVGEDFPHCALAAQR